MKKAQKKKTIQWKWMREWMKNFRLSLSFRVSLNYLRFFLINGVLFFLILTFLYMKEEIDPFLWEAEQMGVLLEIGDTAFQNYVKKEEPEKLLVHWAEDGQERVLYSDTEESWQEYSYTFQCFSLKQRNGEWKLIVRTEESVYRGTEEATVCFYHDFSESIGKVLAFLLNAGIVYLILMLFIVWESRGDNKRIFQPIYDLTETAKTLTVNNLHSERLPEKGMQKELQELTEVFNDMLDRLESAYENQKQFVSNASHELRTPIAVIQGYIRMLARWGSDDPEILNEAIEAIGEESKAMQELVEKLLFLSRHDRKTLKMQKEWFSMGEVVEDMIKETRMVTQNREIKARMIQKVAVYGDDQLLKQALRVFIDNAVKYSRDGDTISIGCENRGGNCILTVEDTGIGMKKEDVNHMFDRFYRSDDIRGKIDGHGLGLSIARLIILAHAGTIKVRTQYTVGTSFIITIPRQRMAPGNPGEGRK